jgi:hypothetical protein
MSNGGQWLMDGEDTAIIKAHLKNKKFYVINKSNFIQYTLILSMAENLNMFIQSF